MAHHLPHLLLVAIRAHTFPIFPAAQSFGTNVFMNIIRDLKVRVFQGLKMLLLYIIITISDLLSLNYLTQAEWFWPLGGSEARCQHNTDFLQYKTIKALKKIMVWVIFKFPTSRIYFKIFQQSCYLSAFNPCLNLPLFYFSLSSSQYSVLPLKQEIRKIVASFSKHLILS